MPWRRAAKRVVSQWSCGLWFVVPGKPEAVDVLLERAKVVELVKALILLVGWCLLFVLCWPLALVVLVLLPLVWLISLPLRVIGITLEAVFALLRAILLLPARFLSPSTFAEATADRKSKV
jgi:hypothetical protein